MRLGALLAAGTSTRFGANDKLLALWKDRPLVTWPAQALCEAQCEMVISVVASPVVASVLPKRMVSHWIAPSLPMSASLKLALREARHRQVQGLLVCLGDMPNVTSLLLRSLMVTGGSTACIQGGRRIPPAYIAAEDFDRVLTLPDGDHGARDFIANLPPDRLIPIDPATAHDVDRTADLQS